MGAAREGCGRLCTPFHTAARLPGQFWKSVSLARRNDLSQISFPQCFQLGWATRDIPVREQSRSEGAAIWWLTPVTHLQAHLVGGAAARPATAPPSPDSWASCVFISVMMGPVCPAGQPYHRGRP